MRTSTVTSLPDAATARTAPDASTLDARQQQALLQRIFDKPADVPFIARFAVINLIGLALVGAAWAQDLLFKPYAADTSHMCYLITVLFALGLVAVFRKDW